jgi:transcriptional regulator with XRE-family HTH domain
MYLENDIKGSKLKEIRKNKKMTRYELQKLSGVSTVQIRNIEKGISEPRAVTLAKLAKALEVDYDELYELFY